MDKPLDCKDPRVIKAYWGLLKHDGVWDHLYQKERTVIPRHYCTKCKEEVNPNYSCPVPDPIPGSLAGVAEAMRIALVENHPHLIESYIKELWHLAGEPDDMAELIYLGPEDKIRAATLAWENSNETHKTTV